MKLQSLLHKVTHCLSSAYTPDDVRGTITIAGQLITDLKPLGGYQRPGITKAGRLSFQGMCGGKRVKVYSFHSPAQAALRVGIQSQPTDGCSFSEIVAADQNLIAEAWIEGDTFESMSAVDLEKASENLRLFLYDIHYSPRLAAFAHQHLSSFCYFEDYLLKRLGVWIHWDPIKQFVGRWQELYGLFKPLIEKRISHPDLSKANLMRENSSGRIFVIDNELLGVGHGWILDKKNSLLAMDPKSDPGEGGVPAHFIETCWQLRRIGSALDAGDLALAAKLAS